MSANVENMNLMRECLFSLFFQVICPHLELQMQMFHSQPWCSFNIARSWASYFMLRRTIVLYRFLLFLHCIPCGSSVQHCWINYTRRYTLVFWSQIQYLISFSENINENMLKINFLISFTGKTIFIYINTH